MWKGFNCRDEVTYRGEKAVIYGKRYGHLLDTTAGRHYDIHIQRGTYTHVEKDVPECLLMEDNINPAGIGAQYMYVGQPHLVKQ